MLWLLCVLSYSALKKELKLKQKEDERRRKEEERAKQVMMTVGRASHNHSLACCILFLGAILNKLVSHYCRPLPRPAPRLRNLWRLMMKTWIQRYKIQYSDAKYSRLTAVTMSIFLYVFGCDKSFFYVCPEAILREQDKVSLCSKGRWS